jgi:hypothetical protein
MKFELYGWIRLEVLNLSLCFVVETAHVLLDSGYCHLHGYIGFYGVDKFSDCSPFVEFSCDLQDLCGKATHS